MSGPYDETIDQCARSQKDNPEALAQLGVPGVLAIHLDEHGLPEQANTVLNRYLQHGDDYAGLVGRPVLLARLQAVAATWDSKGVVEVLDLPLVEAYRLDLGFALEWD